MGIHLLKELDVLRKHVLSLGGMVEDNLFRALQVLESSENDHLIDQIIAFDKEIDRKEVEVEEECLKILALHQPVASDLRYIIAVLKVNNDLERIGDLAANIVGKIRLMDYFEVNRFIETLRTMGEHAGHMLKESLDALVNMDVKQAEKIRSLDDHLDRMLKEIIEESIGEMGLHPKSVWNQVAILGVARNLERIGDLSTNISEDVIYCVRGQIVRHPFSSSS